MPHPSLRPAKQFLVNCVMLKTQSHFLPPAKQFLMNCNDVEGSDPSPLVKLKTQTLLHS
ncbi:MAG: hypothetical protein ACK56F_14265 [bacterium]